MKKRNEAAPPAWTGRGINQKAMFEILFSAAVAILGGIFIFSIVVIVYLFIELNKIEEEMKRIDEEFEKL